MEWRKRASPASRSFALAAYIVHSTVPGSIGSPTRTPSTSPARRIDHVVDVGASGAQQHRRAAHALGVEARDEPGCRGSHLANARRERQQREVVGDARVAALRLDPCAEALQRTPRADGLDKQPASSGLIGGAFPQNQHLGAEREAELRELGGPLAAQRVDRLGDLERVADGAAERLVHVGHAAHDAAPQRLAHPRELVCELARLGLGLHERARSRPSRRARWRRRRPRPSC